MLALVDSLPWLEFVVLLGGCAYLTWRRKHAPRAARYGVAGLALLLVSWGLNIVNYLRGPHAEHWSPAAWLFGEGLVGNLFVAELWQHELLRIGCFLLLARAVVAEREAAVE
jgi:hypothetical protein